MPVFLDRNLSGYDSADLVELVDRGLRAHGVNRRIELVVVASPIRSRGCAQIGGSRIVIALGSPTRFCGRRLSRLLDHEILHLTGLEHGDMTEADLYSTGPTPRWAKGARVRYLGRAGKQF